MDIHFLIPKLQAQPISLDPPSHPSGPTPTKRIDLFAKGTCEKGFQYWIDILLDAFQQNGRAELNRVLQGTQQIGRVDIEDDKTVGAFLVLDPFVRLTLRIDHEWPSTPSDIIV